MAKKVNILLVEDNPLEVKRIKEAFKASTLNADIHVVPDGEGVLTFLLKEGEHANAPKPDLILLDLVLPDKTGQEVLQDIKGDPRFRRTPVLILTNTETEADVVHAYGSWANCFITKPSDHQKFTEMINGIEEFWFNIVRLPSG